MNLEEAEDIETIHLDKDPPWKTKDPRERIEEELICNRCKTKEHPEKCRHNLHYLPWWKSADKMNITQIILKDQVSILQRESM